MSIAESERKLSQKTLNNWLAALHFWHIVNGAPWHGNDMLRHVRRVFTKLVPPSSKRAKRPPVTLEALCILHDRLDLSNTFDASVWALASLAFWSCCRLGELLIAPPQAFDPSKHVSRQVLPLSISTLENGTRHSTFHIPWPSKTTLSLGADISITARNNRTCPLAALLNHSSGSTGLPSHAPLFAYRTGNGWSPMTRWYGSQPVSRTCPVTPFALVVRQNFFCRESPLMSLQLKVAGSLKLSWNTCWGMLGMASCYGL
ncbi:hypothetical protein EDD15DRAFT_2337602 [Pisolithus albus]|nr:hypothetical protein EDD15DRAFT_2337602 [Pisolithus albus]